MKDEYIQIINLLNNLNNIDLSRYDDSFLDKSTKRRITELNCSSAEEYYIFLQQNKNEGRLFVDSLHNSYSDFFRNNLTFSVLEQVILPSIIMNKKNSRNKEIRVWSCACASGQEPYSLAMLFEEFNNFSNNEINYRIIATDHCELQIDDAIVGRYSTEAINSLSLKRLEKWFTKQGNVYAIKQKLRENIDFSFFDLFSEQFKSPPASIFGNFDLIVCANIFFYYQNEYCNKILGKVDHSLADDGFLITGETERYIFSNNNYVEVFPPSGIFSR